MTYVIPPASAATTSWEGDTAYTIPPPSLATTTWVETAPTTDGAVTSLGIVTQFGSPARVTIVDVTGVSPGWAAGTGLSFQQNPADSLGAITLWGVPSSPSLQLATATGFFSFGSGLPRGYPSPTAVTIPTTAVDGFLATQLGAPVASVTTPTIATGWTTTSFGSTRGQFQLSVTGLQASELFGVASVRMSGKTAGWKATSFGSIRGQFHLPVAGFQTNNMFGVASARLSGTAAGAADTYFGVPMSGRAQSAHGLAGGGFGVGTATQYGVYFVLGAAPLTCFGSATSAKPTTFNAFSIPARTWVGHPTGTLRPDKAATGIQVTEFGAHSVNFRYRAFHTPPQCRFGRPLRL